MLLIETQTPLNSPERPRRFYYSCMREARHPYANCLPQIIRKANIPEAEKRTALRTRRFARDRGTTYSIEERLIDLAGPIAGPIQ